MKKIAQILICVLILNLYFLQVFAETLNESSPILYGRIEQIDQVSDNKLKLPNSVLNLETPIDDDNISLNNSNNQNFTGKIIKAFPEMFSGIFGGNITWQYNNFSEDFINQNSDYVQFADLAFKLNKIGCINFVFAKHQQDFVFNSIKLEPPVARIDTPLIASTRGLQAKQLLNKGVNDLFLVLSSNDQTEISRVQLTKQNIDNILFPHYFVFGDFKGGQDYAGNLVNLKLQKNTIRQLSSNIFEQDLIDKITRFKKNQQITTFKEVVIRFVIDNNHKDLNYKIITLSYDHNGNFYNKKVFSGSARLGQVADNQFIRVAVDRVIKGSHLTFYHNLNLDAFSQIGLIIEHKNTVNINQTLNPATYPDDQAH